MSKIISEIISALKQSSHPEKAAGAARFFKTGKGEYGAGDQFIGVTVPKQRQIAKQYYRAISLTDAFTLLKSPIHEERLTALFILVLKFEKTKLEREKKEIYNQYLKHAAHVNNWDLVDSSAHKIVGAYLLHKPEKRQILYTLAKTKNLWKKRIAIISTFTFIRAGQFSDSLKLSKILLQDKHDLKWSVLSRQ